MQESKRHRQDLNELCGGLLAYLSIRLAPVRSPGQPLLLSAGNSTIPSISVPATRESLAVPCSVLVFCVLFSRVQIMCTEALFLCPATMRRSVAHWHTYLAQSVAHLSGVQVCWLLSIYDTQVVFSTLRRDKSAQGCHTECHTMGPW